MDLVINHDTVVPPCSCKSGKGPGAEAHFAGADVKLSLGRDLTDADVIYVQGAAGAIQIDVDFRDGVPIVQQIVPIGGDARTIEFTVPQKVGEPLLLRMTIQSR